MSEICDECDGRFDRPGLHGCTEEKHVKPTLAQRLAMAIEEDISDRRGLRQSWEEIDDVTQQDIRDRWAEIMDEQLGYDDPDE